MGELSKGIGKGGRPKRSQMDTLVQALSVHFPPERIMADLDKAMELATSQNSSRGIIAVLRFVAEYTEGLPVKRVIHSKDGYDRLAELIEVARAKQIDEAQLTKAAQPETIDIVPKEMRKYEK